MKFFLFSLLPSNLNIIGEQNLPIFNNLSDWISKLTTLMSTEEDLKKKKKKEPKDSDSIEETPKERRKKKNKDEEEVDVEVELSKKKKSSKKKEELDVEEEELKRKKKKDKTVEEEVEEEEAKRREKKKGKKKDETESVEEEVVKKKKDKSTVVDSPSTSKKKKKEEIVEEEEDDEKLVAPDPPKTNGLVPFDKDVRSMFDLEWIHFQNDIWDSTPRFVEYEYLHLVKEEKEEEKKDKEDEKQKNLEILEKSNPQIKKNTVIMEKGQSILDANGLEYHEKSRIKTLLLKKEEVKSLEEKEKEDEKKRKNKTITVTAGDTALFDLGKKKKSKTIKKGFLKKRSGLLGFYSWKKIFIVLRDDKLQFYSSKESYTDGSKPYGSLFLQWCVVENVDDSPNDKIYQKNPLAFSLHGRGGGEWFDCETKEERDEWMQAIKGAIKAKFS